MKLELLQHRRDPYVVSDVFTTMFALFKMVHRLADGSPVTGG